MKIFLRILMAIAVIIVILLVVALFVKKDYALERETVINKPKQEVFDYIKYLKNSEKYSKWVMMDPAMKKEYLGTDGTVGFIYTWDSENNKVGKGEQEITNITEGERIGHKIHFIKPFEGVGNSYMATEAVGENATKVKWGFSSTMPYPINIMRLFVNIENMLGNDIDTSLVNLKNVLEK